MKKLLFCLFCFLLSITHISYAENSYVLILKSQNLAPFNAATNKISETLEKNNYQVRIFDLEDNWLNYPTKQIRNDPPKAIITIGTLASKLAYEKEDEIPVFFSVVLRPDLSGIDIDKKKNFSGIALDIPLNTQISIIKTLLPHIKRIGILYSANEEEKIKKTIKYAENLNLQIIAKKVAKLDEINTKIKNLISEDKIDLFLPIMDPEIYSKEAIQFVLLKCSQNNVPVMGLSIPYLNWGALFSLDIDYSKLGKQTTEIFIKRLDNKQISPQIFYPQPSIINYSLNLKAASDLKIDFTKEIIEKAYFKLK